MSKTRNETRRGKAHRLEWLFLRLFVLGCVVASILALCGVGLWLVAEGAVVSTIFLLLTIEQQVILVDVAGNRWTFGDLLESIVVPFFWGGIFGLITAVVSLIPGSPATHDVAIANGVLVVTALVVSYAILPLYGQLMFSRHNRKEHRA